MSYETLATLKSILNPPIPVLTTEKDATIQQALDMATEAIDMHCERTFTPVTATRLFEAPFDSNLYVTDLLSVSAITINGTAIDNTTGYQLRPFTLTPQNPHHTLLRRMLAGYPGPWTYIGVQSVSITGSWGYATTVPATIKQVCRIMAVRMYQREQRAYGNESGTNESGMTIVQSPRPSLDQDCKDLLEPYVLKWKAGTISATDPVNWVAGAGYGERW